jgi:putative salt-induced outer membrane protein
MGDFFRRTGALFTVILLIFSTSALPAQDTKKPVDETEASLSFGLVDTSGNSDTTTFNSKAHILRKKGIYRVALDGLYIYAESGGESVAEKVDITNRWEMRLDSFFPFWDINYYRNPFQKYDYRIATGPGLGYFFLKTEKAYFSASYYIRSHYDHLIGEEEKFVNYTMHNVEGRARYKFTDSLSFTQKVVYSISDRKPADYFFDFEALLKNRISERLALEFSYVASYQNKPVDPTVKRLDTTISTFLVIEY